MEMKPKAEQIEKSGVIRGRRTSGAGSKVGNETKAAVSAAQLGNPTDSNPLTGACRELHSQHPQHYSDRGPHQGTKDHVRHMPLHGMTPSKGYGR